MKRTALIDGDVLVYRAAYKAEKVFDWGDDIYSIVSDLKEAKGHYFAALQGVLNEVGSDQHIAVFSDPGKTFRHDLYEQYKESRHAPGSRKPIVFKALRDFLIAEGGNTLPGLEGDDVLGILQTSMPNTIICTIDKDMKTIPGHHFNFDKKVEFQITREQAWDNFLKQTLTGDPTDGIPGIRGVGAVTAEKLLTKHGFTWKGVVAAYESKGLSEEFALLNARLVRILDVSLYDAKKKQPILWSPQL